MMWWNGFLTPPWGGHGVSWQRLPNQGLATPHLWLHLCYLSASPTSSSPTSSSLCASVSCKKKWVEPPGRLSEEGGGPEGSSAHSTPPATGAPARTWGRREWLSAVLLRHPSCPLPPSHCYPQWVGRRSSVQLLPPRSVFTWFLNDWLE